MQLVCLVCLLLFLSHARTQECDEILISDLGSTDTAGTGGAIAQLFSGQAGVIPDVLVTSSRTVCLAAAATRDKYRFASVITTYSCSGAAAGACPPGPYPRTDQFEFGCVGSVWQDSTLLVDDLNDPVNSSITTLRRDCSFCASPNDANTIGIMPLQNPVDNETHCAVCHMGCLEGDVSLGLCTDVTEGGCCNYYESDTCVVSCSGDLEPDTNYDCVEMCDPLTNPENGQVTVTSRTVGSMATYSCEVGYNLVGNMARTCQLDTGGLEWSDAPTCQPVDCGNLTPPPFGQINLSGTTFGSTATYSCNGDRELTGDMTRTCQANGTWSGTSPECVDTCPLLTNPTNGQIEYTMRTVGGVATYSCNANYTIAGSETRTCMGDLTWSGTNSSCEIVDCGSLPSLDRGEVIQTSTTIGSVANYSCNDRHDLVGVDQRTCLANGAWSDSPPTCVCPLPCQNGGTGNNLCTECDCAVGYSGPECETCALENCFGCRDVPAVCDACDDGYVINTLGVCECTLENCMTCQGVPPTCVQCKDGYIINAVDNTLCDCSLENCLECAGSPPSCEQCRSGFTPLGDGCVFIVRPCNVGTFCQRCVLDDQNFCEECSTGYSINSRGACIIKDNGLDTAEIIGIVIGCIIGAVLLLTITACIVAGIYRHKHPLVVHKKRQKVPPQMFIDGFGNVILHPFHRQATNVLYEEDCDLLELEEVGEELEGEGEDEEGEGEEEEGEEEEGEEESGSEEDSLSKTDEPLDHADDF